MEVSELKNKDGLGIYASYCSVKEAKRTGLIPEEFKDVIKDRCACGSEFMVKNNLKNIRCCDPRCPLKLANSMAEMFTRFGVKGLKVGTCKKIVKWAMDTNFFKIPAHTEILNLREGTSESTSLSWLLGLKYYDLIEGIDVIRNSKLSFAEMVSNIAIPNFDGKSIKVLADLNNTQDLLDLVYKDSGRNLLKYFTDRGVQSIELIYSLLDNVDTIQECEKNLVSPLRSSGLLKMNIAISGSLSIEGRKISRDDFTHLCNNLCCIEGMQVLSITVGKAFQSADFFVIDNMSSSKTCQAALSRQSMSDSKIIFTAEEFVGMLLKEGEKWKNQIQEAKAKMKS